MAKRRTYIPKKVRQQVFEKFNGHCAYCGCLLPDKGWQLDHLVPVRNGRFKKYAQIQLESVDNYFPACRRCNNYKRAHSLQTFRRYIAQIPQKLQRDMFIYKVGKDYGIITQHEWDKLFYFQRCQQEPLSSEQDVIK